LSAIDLAQVASAYVNTRRLERLPDRPALEDHQRRQLARLLHAVASRAPFYAPYRGRSHSDWPIIEKRQWMEHFDTINTVGAKLAPLMQIAVDGERRRDFAGDTRGFSVGLSTGTSGSRGLFMASRAERNRWAGVMLAKMLRGGIWRRHRIALLLRAGSTLYERIGAARLSFRFFDLAAPWEAMTRDLFAWQPTLLVAPAQALALLAAQPANARPQPARVVSCAEVLQDIDRATIESAFGVRVEQIYQATEGFLGATCVHGTLHLNEAQYLIEKEWCADDARRFIPVVTDLHRTTQPVIRYRLNDLLSVAREPCACGSATLAIAAIDGRADDVLYLPTAEPGRRAAVFPDLLSRTVLTAAPDLTDFEVEELNMGRWRVGTTPLAGTAVRDQIGNAIHALATRLGALAPTLEFSATRARVLTRKLRRVHGKA